MDPITPSTTAPSTSADSPEDATQLRAENASLRARIAALEQELVETQARTNAVVARWQERAYWLDRWHLDLNALMRRPGASELRAALRAFRAVGRAARRAKRGLKRS